MMNCPHPSRLFWQFLPAAGLSVLLALPAAAQVRGHNVSGRTRVSGTVMDPAGKPIQGVVIRMVNQTTKSKNTKAKTNKKGKFLNPLVQFGQFKIYAEKSGYKIITYDMDNKDSGDADIGSYRVRFAQAQEPRKVTLRASGVVKLNIVMAPEGDYDRLVMEAAQGKGDDAGAAGKVTRTRHPAEIGREMFDVKNYKGALEKFQEALKLKDSAKDPNIYFAIGRCHYELQQYVAAEQSFRKVEELEGKPRRGLRYYLALLADRQGRKQDAVTLLEEEIAGLETPNASFLTVLGSLYRELGQKDKAISAYRRASTASPGDANVLLNLGSLYADTGEKDKAEKYFKQAVEAGASSGKTGAVIFFNLGALNYNKKRYKAAADAYEQAIKLRPSYASAHRELGYTYQELHDLAKAREHFVEYLKLNPQATDKKGISEMIKVMPKSG